MKKSFCLSFYLFVFSISSFSQTDSLKFQIEQIIKLKKAHVGFAMLGIETGEILSVNGQDHYPMQSVFKFHLALAILNGVDHGKLNLNQEIFIKKSDLLPETWSPIRNKYPEGNVNLKLSEILSYTVSQSDNNGCDILFRLIGGTGKVDDFFKKQGLTDIAIKATEHEMHQDWNVQFTNWTTPQSAAELLRKFFKKEILSEKSTAFLWKIMVETSTGADRLKGKLPKSTEVSHKTGSSGHADDGTTAAFNDIGIVTLPNGNHYAIAVFITDSKEDDTTNASIISDISKAAWDYFTKK